MTVKLKKRRVKSKVKQETIIIFRVVEDIEDRSLSRDSIKDIMEVRIIMGVMAEVAQFPCIQPLCL